MTMFGLSKLDRTEGQLNGLSGVRGKSGMIKLLINLIITLRFYHSPIIDDYNMLQNFLAELDTRKESDQIRLVYIDATDSCM